MRYRQPAEPTHTEPYFEYDPSHAAVMKPLEEEIWAELRLMGVEAVALGVLQRRFRRRRERPLGRLASQIASCIRQADEYFWLAVDAPPRIAPLLHYYSMLNLTKAVIYLESPNRLVRPRDFGHGLIDPHRIKDPASYSVLAETVTVVPGLFRSLYGVLTGDDLPSGTQYRLAHLLRYCPWITHELSEAFGVQSRLLPGQFGVSIDSHRRLGWVAVQIERSAVNHLCRTVSQFRTDAPAFFQMFRRVAAPSGMLGFECDPVPLSPRRPVQSALTSLRPRVRGLRLYRHFLEPEPGDTSEYLIPLQLDGGELLPEPCVLYALTFYLGSLVRYQPHVYDAMLGQQEAWLLEGFVRQCPICFSYMMLNHLWRVEHIFRRA